MRIETQDWSNTCGDGCCYNYGTTLYIDGKEVEDRTFSSSGDAYEYVLTEILGIEVDVMQSDHAGTTIDTTRPNQPTRRGQC